MAQQNWRSAAFQMIVFERDAGAGHETVHVLQFLDAGENMIFDGFG